MSFWHGFGRGRGDGQLHDLRCRLRAEQGPVQMRDLRGGEARGRRRGGLLAVSGRSRLAARLRRVRGLPSPRWPYHGSKPRPLHAVRSRDVRARRRLEVRGVLTRHRGRQGRGDGRLCILRCRLRSEHGSFAMRDLRGGTARNPRRRGLLAVSRRARLPARVLGMRGLSRSRWAYHERRSQPLRGVPRGQVCAPSRHTARAMPSDRRCVVRRAYRPLRNLPSWLRPECTKDEL